MHIFPSECVDFSRFQTRLIFYAMAYLILHYIIYIIIYIKYAMFMLPFIFFLCRNLNKLIIKYQSYPKSRKITHSDKKYAFVTTISHVYSTGCGKPPNYGKHRHKNACSLFSQNHFTRVNFSSSDFSAEWRGGY